MNRTIFFQSLRARNSGVFGTFLSQRQVDGIEALLDAMLLWPVAYVANVLAQGYRETGGGMYPVKETVYRSSKDQNPSDATVKARLTRAWKKGQLPWVKRDYWSGGMFGRGQIQITWEDNYRKMSAVVGVDLVAEPGRALELPISAKIAAEGMKRGMFTGKKLSDYDGPDGFDHFNARDIVNGDKRKHDRGSPESVGALIARYAAAFESALRAAGWREEPAQPVDAVKPAPKPVEPPQAPEIAPSGFWARLVSVVFKSFNKRTDK